jgi:hypothetical protein
MCRVCCFFVLPDGPYFHVMIHLLLGHRASCCFPTVETCQAVRFCDVDSSCIQATQSYRRARHSANRNTSMSYTGLYLPYQRTFVPPWSSMHTAVILIVLAVIRSGHMLPPGTQMRLSRRPSSRFRFEYWTNDLTTYSRYRYRSFTSDFRMASWTT